MSNMRQGTLELLLCEILACKRVIEKSGFVSLLSDSLILQY